MEQNKRQGDGTSKPAQPTPSARQSVRRRKRWIQSPLKRASTATTPKSGHATRVWEFQKQSVHAYSILSLRPKVWAADFLNKPETQEDLTARLQSVPRLKEYQDTLLEQNEILEHRVKERTLDIMRKTSGPHYDPDLFAVFETVIEDFEEVLHDSFSRDEERELNQA